MNFVFKMTNTSNDQIYIECSPVDDDNEKIKEVVDIGFQTPEFTDSLFNFGNIFNQDTKTGTPKINNTKLYSLLFFIFAGLSIIAGLMSPIAEYFDTKYGKTLIGLNSGSLIASGIFLLVSIAMGAILFMMVL